MSTFKDCSEISSMCTTKNGAQVLCSTTTISVKWILKITGGMVKSSNSYLLEIPKQTKPLENPELSKLDYELDPFEIVEHMEILPTKPFLTCLHYDKDKSISFFKTNQILKKSFYKLFGRNSSLSSNEVVIVGFPDGRTFWASIMPDNSIQNLKLLCDLNQPIIHVEAVKEYLVIIGYQGKVTICCPESSICIFYIPGPVKSCLCRNEKIYHIIPSGNILINHISINPDKKLNLKTTWTKIKDAERLQILNEDGNWVIAYLTKNGNLKPLPLEISGESHNAPAISNKNLLDKIQEHSENTIALTKEVKYVKTLLHDLSIASSLLAKKCNEITESCFLKIERKSDDSYNFIVSVKNLEVLAVTNCWNLSCHLSEPLQNNNSYSVSKTEKIRSSTTNCIVNYNLGFYSKFKLKIPLVLNCGLVVNPSESSLAKYNNLVKSLFPMYFTIKEFEITEITLLENQNIEFPYINEHECNISQILIEIAKPKLNEIPVTDEINNIIAKNSTPVKNSSASTYFLNFTFLKSVLTEKILNLNQSYKSQNLISFVSHKSLIAKNTSDSKFLYMYHPIEMKELCEEGKLQLTISSPVLLPVLCLRRAIAGQFLNAYENQKQSEIDEVISVDSTLIENIKYILKKLHKIKSTDKEKILQIYLDTRQKITPCLPIF